MSLTLEHQVLLSLAQLIGCLVGLHRLLLVAQPLMHLPQEAVGIHGTWPHHQELSKVPGGAGVLTDIVVKPRNVVAADLTLQGDDQGCKEQVQ